MMAIPASPPPPARSAMAAALAAALLPAPAAPAHVQDDGAQQKVRAIDELVESYAALGQLSGSVLVSLGGEVIYRRGVGMANQDWGIPNTPETRHRIASHGKAFTAAIILQLADEGLVDLHAPLSSYLPEYRRDIAERITIHLVLLHSAGVPRTVPQWGSHRDPFTLEQTIDAANALDLEFEPGERFSYSNVGYNLLARVIERATGTTYSQALRRRILEPLEMSDTGLVLDGTAVVAQRADGYERTFWGELRKAPYIDETFAIGSGGMYSTVDDMFKWNRALSEGSIFSSRARDLMFTAHLHGAGYGWNVGTYVHADGSKHALATGFGATSGAASVTYRLHGDDAVVLVLGNMRPMPQGRIASNITNVLVGVPPNPIVATRDAELYSLLLDRGIDAALKIYDDGDRSWPDTARLNQMGYELLGDDRVNQAILLFRFNVAAHPDYANGFDSLGEAYLAAGDRDRAVASYRRALELEPSMATAQAALRKLQER